MTSLHTQLGIVPAPMHSQEAAARIHEESLQRSLVEGFYGTAPVPEVKDPPRPEGKVRAKPKHLYTTQGAQMGLQTPWRDFSKLGLRTHHVEQLQALASAGPLTGKGISARVKAGVKHMPELVSLGLITAVGTPLVYEITEKGLAVLANGNRLVA